MSTRQRVLVLLTANCLLLGPARRCLLRCCLAYLSGSAPREVIHLTEGVDGKNEVEERNAEDEKDSKPKEIVPAASEEEDHDLHSHNYAIQISASASISPLPSQRRGR